MISSSLPFADFEFMRRALVGSVALALGAGPIGVFLLLRRMSLTGDAMAHAVLPGAAVGFLVAGLSLPAMTIGGLVAGLAVAFLSGLVARTTVLREDASLAAFYLISLALGVMIVSMKGSSIDLLHLLFGTALALDDAALLLVASIASATLVVLALDLPPARHGMPRSGLPRERVPLGNGRAPRLPRPRRPQSGRRVPGARNPALRRHHDAAGRRLALLVRGHHGDARGVGG